QNGRLDMCHLLYESDCPNLGGLTGGCCGPCWNTNVGEILPPGWFAYGINGSCAAPGPPIAVDWGDGNSCGCCMGPWLFCFDLVVRADSNCVEDSSHDLSIGFFTFADGQVGSWTGGPSVCDMDQPAKMTLPFCCSSVETQHINIDTLCGGVTFDYILPDNGADYWQWTYITDTITGALEGSGGPGVAFLGNLTNPGPDVDSIVFTFLGYTGGICPEFGISATIYIYPQIHIEFDSALFCSTPEMPYTLDPAITGGTGNYTYQWSPGGETTPTIMIPDPVDSSVYVITVTDSLGCASTAEYVVEAYSTFPAFIQSVAIENCEQETLLEGNASGGIEPYQFIWTLPGNTNAFGDFLLAEESGVYFLEVTDAEGCTSADTVVVTFHEGFVDLGPDTIFVETQTTLNAGTGYVDYLWNTGETTQAITVANSGCYSVTTTDVHFCMASDTICVEFITDVEDIGQSDFLQLFPNPNGGTFTLSAELSSPEQWKIEIYNTIGIVVYTSSPETISGKASKMISLENAVPGMYTISVWIGEKKYSGKLMVK
ncbi:MAG: T9SS type A sorting domain-containing protein, partial [Saprospiraceae bacterium]